MIARWWELAACRGVDSEIFFSTSGNYPQQAAGICARCPVTHECLEEGIAIRPEAYDQGWRAGTTQKDRIRIRRTRSRQRRKAVA